MLSRSEIQQILRAAGASVFGRPASKYQVRRQDGAVIPWSEALRSVHPGEEVVILVYDGVAEHVMLETELPVALNTGARDRWLRPSTPSTNVGHRPGSDTAMSEQTAIDFFSIILEFSQTDDAPDGDAELASELEEKIKAAEKGLKEPAIVKEVGKLTRDGKFKAGLYKALMAAQAEAAPAAEGKASGGGKKTPAKKAASGEKAPKKAKEPKAPKSTRADGFLVKKADCVEQKIVAPIGVAWQRGCAMYELHKFLADGNVAGDGEQLHTMEQIKERLPELKSVARYVKECESLVKIGPLGWLFERRTVEGGADQLRIYPNPEFTVQDGCDLLD